MISRGKLAQIHIAKQQLGLSDDEYRAILARTDEEMADEYNWIYTSAADGGSGGDPDENGQDETALLGKMLRLDVDTAGVAKPAAGNPFFFEEICRAVDAQGGPVDVPAVPDTVEELLRARIERLPDAPRTALHAAAIFGREFTVRLLRHVWRGAGSLDAHVELLTR